MTAPSARAPSVRRLARLGALAFAALFGTVLYSRPALAHAGSLAGSLRSVPAPFWLVVLSGGGVVGVSFLFSSFVTDTAALNALARPRRLFGSRLRRRAAVERGRRFLGWGGVAVLVLVVWAGLTGPAVPLANLAVLVVWVGWWAGFTMFTYLVVDAWPLVNPWRTLARAVRRVASEGESGRASAGLPARLGAWPSVLGLLGLALACAGFACFLAVYRLAARLARRTADTYVTARFVAGWFAPALVPIAAGYHLAHFLGYFLGLLPAFVAVASTPLSPPAAVPVLGLPPWFGAVQLVVVVGGHLVAVWVAHARSFDLFPGRLQPLRSQYPFVAVTVLYTVVSLWVVAQPVVGAVR